MKTIIALANASNRGKTQTLRELARILVEMYPDCIPVEPTTIIIPERGDFRLVIRIGERTVAIESQGDPGTELRERLIDLSDRLRADLIFCTTRTRGDTVQAVLNLTRTRNFEAIWTSPYIKDDMHDFLNRLKANHLVELVTRASII